MIKVKLARRKKIAKFGRSPMGKFGKDILVISLFAATFLAMLVNSVQPVSAQGGDWLSGWGYRMKITINENVIDSNLDNFPVTVFLDNANFTWAYAKDNGDDIRFTTSDGTTLLSYERERHDKNNGYAEYHVKVPSVSGTENTIIYLYYGNYSASDGANPTAVWDSNFKARYGMKDLTTSTIEDSTSNNNDGTKQAANEPIEVDGKIGRAQDFVPTDYITIPNNFMPAGNITYEFWTNPDSVAITQHIFSTYYNPRNMLFGIKTTSGYLDVWDGAWRTNLTTISTGTWQYFAYVWDGTTGYLYKNGTLVTSWSATPPSNTLANKIGTAYDQSYPYDGKVDEFRGSSTNRSAAWIKVSYHSGNNSLLSFGSEEIIIGDVLVSNIQADNALIDRDIDFAPSGVVTGTRIQADVEFPLTSSVSKENVRFVIYDKNDTIIDNKVATENLKLTENKQRFFVNYSALDNTLTNNQLGGWDVTVIARDNAGGSGVRSQTNLFYVDDLTATQNVENLVGHRIRTYGTVSRMSGTALAGLENVTINDNAMGMFYASLSGNNWENIRAPTTGSEFYLMLKAENLDGLTDNISYAFPNFAPQIVSITASENLVDRKQDYTGSGAVLATTLVLRVKDNDGYGDMNATRIAVRDNLDAVQENQDVWATKVVVDENTYDVTLSSYNPPDNLANNKLGPWDVWGYVSDNWASTSGWQSSKFTVDDRKSTISFNPANPYLGWSLTVSGVNSCHSITKNVTGSWLVDNVHGTINMGAFNTYSQTYTVTDGLGDNVSVIIRTFDGVLDGVSLSSYLVAENIKFEVRVRFEENYGLVSWIPDENKPIDLLFEWDGGTYPYTMENNPENIIIPTAGITMKTVKITDNDQYWRYVVPECSGGVLTFIIVDDYTKLDQYRFFLQDYTTQYIPPDGRMIVKYWIGTNLATINDDYWGADWRTTAWLITGIQYQLWVVGVNAPLRLVGPIDAVAPAEEKTIVVQIILLDLAPIRDYLYWSAWRVDNNIIRAEYQDNTYGTVEAHVAIYDTYNNLMVQYQVDNDWFIVTWAGAENDKTYNVVLTVQHETYGSFSFSSPVGLAYGPPGYGGGLTEILGMAISFASLAAVIAIGCVGMIFDQPRAHLAALAMAIATVFFWMIGWLQLPGAYGGMYVAVLIFFFALMFALTRKKGW